jgi:uncharacterized membrane protein YdfJ with MMPL/SSD domain
MLTWWGRGVVAHRRLAVVAALVLVAVGVGWGAGVFARLASGGFEDPGSESARAAKRIAGELGNQNPDVLALYSSRTATVDDPSFRNPVAATAGRLRTLPAVAGVTSYYDSGSPSLLSRDRHATYVVIRLRALDDSGKRAEYDAIRSELDAPGLTTQIGGTVAIGARVDEITKSDVARGEMVAMPIVLILLIFIFGGVVAAGMPLLIGVLAVLGALTATRAITLVTDVSTFAINSITLLGLGMAIDYSLLVINRFREELRAGNDTARAVERTVATAGRTVLVSGLLVTLSLASLLIFPQVFLRSMAWGGMAAVLIAMLSSVTVLPAVLAMLGPRINAWRVPTPWRRTRMSAVNDRPDEYGGWARLARSVMRRPVRYIAAVVLVLTTLALPLLHVRFGSVDERVLPPESDGRLVAARIATQFHGAAPAPIQALIEGASPTQTNDLLARVRALPDVTGAQMTAHQGRTWLISAGYDGAFAGQRARDAVREIRELDAPTGVQMLVTGDPAVTADGMSSLGARLPWMLTLMAAATLAVLLLAFGSVLLPIKAVLMNIVSIAASFGVLVWGFQDGHLAGLLGFTSTGHLEPTVLILILAVLFGLATDYEVFLLARVREQWDATADNTDAVATGVQRTGRIITAAALLLAVVTAGFASGQIVITKLIGVGMVVGIALDATLIRALLVPATMRLLGRWNWWAPGPLTSLYRRYGIHRPTEPVPRPARAAALVE